jgi:hypothetical protein
MTDWKLFERKQFEVMKVLSWKCHGGTEENHEKPRPGWRVTQPRFECGPPKSRSKPLDDSE